MTNKELLAEDNYYVKDNIIDGQAFIDFNNKSQQLNYFLW